ncbi:hypothetical protein R3P38DRAFT_614396 [Favolaschia claudopus]|uniref:Uncharacterized protein n=1 Tax=Favolaschia claudopus TaxID=2862362 RepID=A0AAW0C8P2_9AGAR
MIFTRGISPSKFSLASRFITSRFSPNNCLFLHSLRPYQSLRLNSSSAAAVRRRTARKPVISTLDPKQLKPSDYVDISEYLEYSIRSTTEDPNSAARTSDCITYYKHKGVEHPFPQHSAGYFYFHRPPDLPPMSGALRFRCVPVNDPGAFDSEESSDLLRPDSLPWEVPLSTLSNARPLLRDLLLRDGLVTADEVEESMRRFPFTQSRRSDFIFRHDQMFSIPFECMHIVTLVNDPHQFRFRSAVFGERRLVAQAAGSVRRPPVFPYSGRALVRFELMKLPRYSEARVVLRVVKMVVPPTLLIPDYDGYLPAPREGKLITRPHQGTGKHVAAWSRALGSPLGRFLRGMYRKERSRKDDTADDESESESDSDSDSESGSDSDSE